MATNWYQIEAAEVANRVGTDPRRGLGSAEATRRLAESGPNETVDRGGKSAWKILLEQLTGVMTLLLIVSAGVSIYLGDLEDALAILAIVALNTVLGFTQEFRAEKAMDALKQMSVPHVRVRRDGRLAEISAREVVPGDVVLLETGNTIPADGRLVESANLRVQEAILTGESEPVEKDLAALPQDGLSLGDRHNSVYSGTVVTYGRGEVIVTETGMHTQLGKIAEMLQSVDEGQTPLQRRLDQVGRILALAALAIVAVVFTLGVLRGEELRLMFLTAISLAVAAVPEGLATVVTIALSLGAQRMLKRNALIRKLPAVETLGSVTVICSDKTGTLTQNQMTVTVLDVAGRRLDVKEHMHKNSPVTSRAEPPLSELNNAPAMRLLLSGGALCSDASLEASGADAGEVQAIGDPTEGALVIAAAQAGLWKDTLEESLPRVSELPFDSQRKRMTTVHPLDLESLPELRVVVDADRPQTNIAFTKGAVDGLIEVSSQVWVDGRPQALDEGYRRRIQESNDRMAGEGLRVLGVSFQLRSSPRTDDPAEPLEKNLVFLGMFGMIDPPRGEVKDAVDTALSAGIRPIMITGDHALTAASIARELGISDPAANGRALTGAELERMSAEELGAAVGQVSVYARVSPEHKLRIVQALQQRGEIVAMTGDGVNDAPALKMADIGVAMGITGTDVSKEAADIVLLDDNFATIVAAVEEGRRIFANIRKFIKYALTSNLGEILVMLAAPFLGMPLPLLPLQILWINLVTDGLPGLALMFEPAEPGAMRRPPYPPRESIFSRGLGRDILWIGTVLAAAALGMGYWAWAKGDAGWQTMVFTTVTLSQMGNVLASRSEHSSLFKLGVFTNPLLLASVVLTVVLQLGVIYLPFMQEIFKTVPLNASDLAISLGLSTVVFFAVETVKWGLRKAQG